MDKEINNQSTRDLPDHNKVLQAILKFFSVAPGVIGCYLSGSTATGKMDEDSDLDIGVLFENPEARENIWSSRWNWEITPWFHRLEADHIKPYFVIYFYEPNIKADVNFYIASDLPPYVGGPYEVLWDDTGALKKWLAGLTAPQDTSPDWGDTIHEDERFWAWMFYLYSHVHRGEYYHAAYEFPALRDILEKWAARLGGHKYFNSRYLEDYAYADILVENSLFPAPDLESLKISMVDAMAVQLSLREKITKRISVAWVTTDGAIKKIENLVRSL